MMSASVRVESEEKEYQGSIVIDPLCDFYSAVFFQSAT